MDGVTRTITYADAANPFNWFNGTDYTNLTWTQGRRLSSVTKGSQTYSYEYDMSGVRSVKVADGLRHEYVTQNGRVVREKVTNASTGAFQYMLDFVYDESGHPFLMRRYYNEAQTNYNTYHYVLNAQGDVVKLVHSANITVKAEYTYDAWGNVLTATGDLADVNPLRYRGYYYDQETGFYYLQSRYYDPMLGRFINADSFASTGQGFLGYNMFAYCNNNPLTCTDSSGEEAVNYWQDQLYIACVGCCVLTGEVLFWSLFGWMFYERPSSYSIDHYLENENVCFSAKTDSQEVYGGHTKNARSSTSDKHQRGDSRRRSDQGKNKKRQKPGWKDRSNTRKGGTRVIYFREEEE